MINIVFPSCEVLSVRNLGMVDMIPDRRLVLIGVQNETEKFEGSVKSQDVVLKLNAETGGPLCSCLMAIDQINNEDEVLIIDESLELAESVEAVLNHFRQVDADCGVVTTPSDEENRSYICVENGTDDIIEAAWKRKVSNKAIAGTYYFKHGKDYIESAKNAIRKGSSFEGRFYLTAAVNEMILKNKCVKDFEL